MKTSEILSRRLRLVLVVLACTVSSHAQSPQDSLIRVPMVRILTDPLPYVRYEGLISTVGYLSESALNLRLFLTEDHARFGDASSAVSVIDDTSDASIYASECLEGWVEIVGILVMTERDEVVLKHVRQIRRPRIEGSRVCFESTSE